MWWRLGVTLALETSLLCLAALALRALARSAVGRRALWQITTVGLAALVACELTGASRGLLGWAFAPAEPKSPAAFSTRMAVAVVLDTPTLPIITDIVAAKPAPTALPTAPQPRLGWPGLVWLGGFALVALLLALGRLVFVLVWRRRRVSADPALVKRVQELARQLGIRRRVRLTEAAGLTGPIAFGIVRLGVCLPPNFTKDFSPTQQDAMLAHELAHLAAGDPVWHSLADAVAALLWWQPLAWWIRRKLRAASETAADEASLLIENGPHALAECLVVLGRQLSQRRSLGWLGVDGGGFRSNLGKRVERLVHLSGQPWRPARRTSAWTVKTLGPLALVLIIIAGTAWTQPSEARVKDLKEAWKQSAAGLAMNAMWSSEQDALPQKAASPAGGNPVTGDSSEPLPQQAPIPWQSWSPEAVLLAQAEGRPVLVSFTAEWCLAAHTNEWTSLEIPAVRARLREINAVALRGDDTLGDAAIAAELRRFGRANVPLVLVYSTNYDAPPVVLPEVLTPEIVLTALDQAMLPPIKPANDSRAQRGFEYTVRPGDTLSVIVKWCRDRGMPLTMEQVKQANPTVNWSRLRVGLKIFLPVGGSPEAGAARREALDTASNLVDDGKRLYEAGKLHEARSKFEQAQAMDPANERAKLYLRLLEQREKTRPAPTNAPLLHPAAPTQPAQTNTVRMSPSRQALFEKLDQIRFDEVGFDAVPLEEVVKFLAEQCKARDPQHRGVNFIINTLLPDPGALTPQAGSNDLRQVVIRLKPPLRNVSLRQVLGAVAKTASQPLTYSVEDYAVIFAVPTPGTPLLYTRVFKVDPNIFLKNFRELAGAKASPERKGKGSPSSQDEIVSLIRTVFAPAAGVDLTPPKQVFFNDRIGQLMVRASREDLDVIERLVQRLNLAPPQVTVDTRIVEMPDEDGQALEWFRRTVHVIPTPTNQTPETPIGILTDPQYRELIRYLEQTPGVDMLKMPRVTTLSGRQLQQKVVDVKYVVTNLQIDLKGTATSTNGMPGFRPVTESVELGPVVDVVPYVLADGLSFQLTFIASIREFIGYDMDTWGAPRTQPKPIFSSQQALGRATVFDGQTVCLSLGSFTQTATPRYKYKVPFLGEMPVMGPLFRRDSILTRQRHRFVFVTPTIIDPAGNRVHTEDEIPNSIPPQPTPPIPR